MKILDAGTEVLDDYDVLNFIREKRVQHEAERKQAEAEKRPKTQRPANFMKALEKHEAHLVDKDRPFLSNPLYTPKSSYLPKLLQTLSPRVQLTKSEYLVLVNHRPCRRAHVSAMIEDVDTRFTREEQNFIRDVCIKVLGMPKRGDGDDMEENLDTVEVEVKG